jgi:hypothetical protein
MTNSCCLCSWITQHTLCRVVPVLTKEKEEVVKSYDKVKYLELLLNAVETVLGYFGFDGSVYKSQNRAIRSSKQKKWWNELREERRKDVEAERATN